MDQIKVSAENVVEEDVGVITVEHHQAVVDYLLGFCSRLKKENDELRATKAYLTTKLERYRREFFITPYNIDRKETD